MANGRKTVYLEGTFEALQAYQGNVRKQGHYPEGHYAVFNQVKHQQNHMHDSTSISNAMLIGGVLIVTSLALFVFAPPLGSLALALAIKIVFAVIGLALLGYGMERSNQSASTENQAVTSSSPVKKSRS